MSGLVKCEVSNPEDEWDEHADRLLAWDTIHVSLCAGKSLYASRIADRVGLSTTSVSAIIKRMGEEYTPKEV